MCMFAHMCVYIYINENYSCKNINKESLNILPVKESKDYSTINPIQNIYISPGPVDTSEL